LQKVTGILFIIFILTSCSLMNKSSISSGRKSDTNNISINDVIESNVGRNSFYIEKAEVSYSSDSIKERFLINLKFEYPDKYLLSVRSKTGFEAMRIFISKDTLLINDRINQKLFYGKDKFLVTKFGFSAKIIPVVFGDLVLGNGSDTIIFPCSENISKIESSLKGRKINYSINCNYKKVNSAFLEYNTGERLEELRFEKFKNFENLIIPTQIVMKEVKNNIMIWINIIKMHSGLSDSIEFIPGKKYEQIELL
jgi:hypothetical protein